MVIIEDNEMRRVLAILFVSLGLMMGPFLMACGDGDGRSRRPTPRPLRRPPADVRPDPIPLPPVPDSLERRALPCKAKSVRMPVGYGDCVFELPNLNPKRSNLYTGTYREPDDIHGINDGGPIFGLGQWVCDNGEWREFKRRPICRTCRKGRSFRECLIFWNVPPCIFEGPGACRRQ